MGRYEYGTPGGSLGGDVFSDRRGAANVGAIGERKTADLLRIIQQERHPDRRFAVVHDVMLPSDRYTANIDHIVIAGKKVLIIDSKVWSAGFYFTVRGHTYVFHSKKTKNTHNKTLSRFDAGDHRTLPMTLSVLQEWTLNNGFYPVTFMTPVMLVWPPEGKQNPSLRFYSPQGSVKAISPEKARVRLANMIPNQAPDPRLLDLFRSLLG
ncbi:MAG: nuclease-related domain-containing protein [Ferrimicrobium acidiphilum]